jgi:hypothetical protein
MDIVEILIGALLLLIGILVLIFAKSQSKNVGSRIGYVYKIYIGGLGFLLIGVVIIVREIIN